MLVDLKNVVTVDFETLGIDDRPHYPPNPVGVAVKIGAKPSRYYSWGHIGGGNNCSWGEARRVLAELWASKRPLLMHNANFDIDVAEVHMGMPRLSWSHYHDTLPGLFLLDPRAPTYSLKPSAERLLGLKPGERDAVTDWLVAHQPVSGARISDKPKSNNYAGTYIAYAPADLVGRYACGDVDRTFKLAEHVFKQLEVRRMVEPYNRERQLLLPLLAMEREGVRVDVRRLLNDVNLYNATLARLDLWLKKRLNAAGSGLNLDSGRELAEALIRARLATKESLGVTPSGQIATSKDALDAGVTDRQVLAALRYRGALNTCLHTFMEPWYRTAAMEGSGGRIFTRWHSTRTDHREGGAGTRTGRLSSTPNFQNLPNEIKVLFRDEAHKDLPKAPIELPELPLVRSYVIADQPDHVLVDRDYNQQELRVLAHFEDSDLKAAYQADPRLDVHTMMQRRINELLHADFDRKPVKTAGFAILYGTGLGHLAEMLGTTVEIAKTLKATYLKVLPGLKAMYEDMTARAKAHEPIRTWGGREYFCEPPVFVDGRMRTFDYKMVNCLIQGSSADITKTAVINYTNSAPTGHHLRLTVHDELVISLPKKELNDGMRVLREAMESVPLDVVLLSDGGSGETFQKAKSKINTFKDVREVGGAGRKEGRITRCLLKSKRSSPLGATHGFTFTTSAR